MREAATQSMDSVKRVIRSAFPEAEISILDNPRDFAGGVLYVRNVPPTFKNSFGRVVEFVTIPLDSKNRTDFIVVPIPEQTSQSGPDPAVQRKQAKEALYE